MNKGKYIVKHTKVYNWGIWADGNLVEGGFFSEGAALDYLAKEYGE